jgi:hypothetical protein
MVKEIILFLLVIDQLSVVDCRRRIHVYPTLNYMSVIVTLNLLKNGPEDPIETKTFRSETHRISGRE